MFFFFSSRRRHTISYGDWSSDVCSSDLPAEGVRTSAHTTFPLPDRKKSHASASRSEERRVGKEGRSRWSPYHEKKKRTDVVTRGLHCGEVTRLLRHTADRNDDIYRVCDGSVCDVLRTDAYFFFSSRRRHTRSYGDWSSDVCSSD